jgi:hypothetical protein
MKKKIIAGVTLSVVLIIILAAILAFGGSVFPDCSGLKNQIYGLLENANYCSADSDCSLKKLGCPFGCGRLINKNADLAAIMDYIEEYYNACDHCLYDCQPPKPEQIKCINNKCIDSGFENK